MWKQILPMKISKEYEPFFWKTDPRMGEHHVERRSHPLAQGTVNMKKCEFIIREAYYSPDPTK